MEITDQEEVTGNGVGTGAQQRKSLLAVVQPTILCAQ